MTPSKQARDIIADFEGCKLSAYLCPANVPTIGYGRTSNVKMGDTCTQEQADAWLQEELDHFGSGVAEMIKVEVNQNQFDALVSFAYNVGLGALKGSTLLRLLNQGKHSECGEQFLRWNKAGGKVLAGLIRRRIAEKVMFES
jgi:lysozyme